jgi:hypothetical protein
MRNASLAILKRCGVPILCAAVLFARIPWREQRQPAELCRMLSVPAALLSVERMHTCRADLTDGARPYVGEPNARAQPTVTYGTAALARQ